MLTNNMAKFDHATPSQEEIKGQPIPTVQGYPAWQERQARAQGVARNLANDFTKPPPPFKRQENGDGNIRSKTTRWDSGPK